MKQVNNNDIYEMVMANQNMIKVLLRNRQPNKLNIVEDEVLKRGRMNVTQIMDLVRVERPTSLNYMKKLGRKPGFSYIVGDKKSKRAGLIIYNESQVFRDQIKQFDSLFKEKQQVTYYKIMESFKFTLLEAKQFANMICETTKKYSLEGEFNVKKL